MDSAQIRQLLATIDFRENDVFRHTFGSEDELSRDPDRLFIRSFSALCPDFNDEYRACKNHLGEKGIRFDLLIKAEDDQGNSLVINLEMQNYQMSDSLAMRSQGYLSRIVADQLCVGDPYEFNPVIQVMLTTMSRKFKRMTVICMIIVILKKKRQFHYRMNGAGFFGWRWTSWKRWKRSRWKNGGYQRKYTTWFDSVTLQRNKKSYRSYQKRRKSFK